MEPPLYVMEYEWNYALVINGPCILFSRQIEDVIDCQRFGSKLNQDSLVDWYTAWSCIPLLFIIIYTYGGLGTPKSSMLVGFSLKNHPFIGAAHLLKTPICMYVRNEM